MDKISHNIKIKQIYQNEHDCISCPKNITNKIPKHSQCQAICGDDLPSQKVPKKYRLTPNEIILINKTANFMELLTTPKQQTLSNNY